MHLSSPPVQHPDHSTTGSISAGGRGVSDSHGTSKGRTRPRSRGPGRCRFGTANSRRKVALACDVRSEDMPSSPPPAGKVWRLGTPPNDKRKDATPSPHGSSFACGKQREDPGSDRLSPCAGPKDLEVASRTPPALLIGCARLASSIVRCELLCFLQVNPCLVSVLPKEMQQVAAIQQTQWFAFRELV